jgi:hypothetical protein
MKRPSIFILLALLLVAASSMLIIRSRSGAAQTAASPKIPAQTDPFHGKTGTAITTHQNSTEGMATPPKNQAAVAKTPQPQSNQHAADSQIAASPTVNAAISGSGLVDRPSPPPKKSAPVAHESLLPAIRLADDVRLPAALMPHDTAGESPIVTAARAAIGDRFYRELQEIAAKEAPTEATTEAEATVVIRKSFATENALKRANEEYRAFFGDEAFNRRTMDTHLEVKQPALEATPDAGPSY